MILFVNLNSLVANPNERAKEDRSLEKVIPSALPSWEYEFVVHSIGNTEPSNSNIPR